MYAIRKRDNADNYWLYLAHSHKSPASENLWVLLSPLTRNELVNYENARVNELMPDLTSDCQLVKLDGETIDGQPIVRLDHSFKLR